MSSNFFRSTPVARNDGRSVSAHLAYRCSAVVGEYDFTAKRQPIAQGIVGASLSLDEFSQTIEASEKRKDARLLRQFEFALPFEASKEQQTEITRRYAVWLNETFGCAVHYAVHSPDGWKRGEARTADNKKNYHAHVTATDRTWENGKPAAKKIRSWNAVGWVNGTAHRKYEEISKEVMGEALPELGTRKRLPVAKYKEFQRQIYHEQKNETEIINGTIPEIRTEYSQQLRSNAEINNRADRAIRESERIELIASKGSIGNERRKRNASKRIAISERRSRTRKGRIISSLRNSTVSVDSSRTDIAHRVGGIGNAENIGLRNETIWNNHPSTSGSESDVRSVFSDNESIGDKGNIYGNRNRANEDTEESRTILGSSGGSGIGRDGKESHEIDQRLDSQTAAGSTDQKDGQERGNHRIGTDEKGKLETDHAGASIDGGTPEESEGGLAPVVHREQPMGDPEGQRGLDLHNSNRREWGRDGESKNGGGISGNIPSERIPESQTATGSKNQSSGNQENTVVRATSRNSTDIGSDQREGKAETPIPHHEDTGNQDQSKGKARSDQQKPISRPVGAGNSGQNIARPVVSSERIQSTSETVRSTESTGDDRIQKPDTAAAIEAIKARLTKEDKATYDRAEKFWYSYKPALETKPKPSLGNYFNVFFSQKEMDAKNARKLARWNSQKPADFKPVQDDDPRIAKLLPKELEDMASKAQSEQRLASLKALQEESKKRHEALKANRDRILTKHYSASRTPLETPQIENEGQVSPEPQKTIVEAPEPIPPPISIPKQAEVIQKPQNAPVRRNVTHTETEEPEPPKKTQQKRPKR